MTEKDTIMARRQRPGIIESDMGDSNRKNPVTRPMAMTIERIMSVKLAKSNMKKIFLEKSRTVIHFSLKKIIYNNSNHLFYNIVTRKKMAENGLKICDKTIAIALLVPKKPMFIEIGIKNKPIFTQIGIKNRPIIIQFG
jgi:hypothetical protein